MQGTLNRGRICVIDFRVLCFCGSSSAENKESSAADDNLPRGLG